MKITKKLIIKLLLILTITILITGGIYIYYQDTSQNEKIELEEEVIEITEPIEEVIVEEPTKVYVDIKGAIATPGVYEIEETKKVIDVVNLAGGFTENADTSLNNLAKKVSNEMVVIIYTKKEVRDAKLKETLSITSNDICVCPEVNNDACLNSTNTKETTNTAINNEKVNINTATLEQFQTLTGIGESKAKAIIAYREENGNFENIEDLKNVSGIGESVYEKIKNNITV